MLLPERRLTDGPKGGCQLRGPAPRGCFSRCNHFTPCLWRNATAVTQLAHALYDAAIHNGSVGFERELLALAQSAPRTRRTGAEEKRRLARLHDRYRQRRLALRITGPLQDGFWVRATVVLAHARVAQRMGLSPN